MKFFANLSTALPRKHPKISGYHIPTRKQEIWEGIKYLILAFLSLIGFSICLALLIGG